MNIIHDFIPEGRKNRPGYKIIGPEYITIHSTGNTNKGANAAAHGSYLKGAAANVPASWHFTVDDKEIRQHMPLSEVAWHAGDGSNGPGNRKSIAMEICENQDGNAERAIKNAAWLAAYLLKRFGLGIDRIKQHYDWSGKNCPRLLRSKPNGWNDFVGLVQQNLQEGNQTDYYIVKPGDTLSGIANRFGFDLQELVDYNSINNPDLIVPGQKIMFPVQEQQPKHDDNFTLIRGQAVATKGQAKAWLKKRAPDWVLMVDLYYSIAPKYNIRADVALAQACKETGFFRYGGLVQPWQNNFCGLGATGQASDGKTPLNGADPEKVRFEKGVHGAIFVDRATGVEAHIQHLYAYATTEALPADAVLVDPRFTLVRRGTAPYVEHLVLAYL